MLGECAGMSLEELAGRAELPLGGAGLRQKTVAQSFLMLTTVRPLVSAVV